MLILPFRPGDTPVRAPGAKWVLLHDLIVNGCSGTTGGVEKASSAHRPSGSQSPRADGRFMAELSIRALIFQGFCSGASGPASLSYRRASRTQARSNSREYQPAT